MKRLSTRMDGMDGECNKKPFFVSTDKSLFSLHFHVLFTSPLASHFSSSSFIPPRLALQTNWFLIVFDPFTADKKFFDLEGEILENSSTRGKNEKRFPLWACGGVWGAFPPALLRIYVFHLIFPLKTRTGCGATTSSRKNPKVIGVKRSNRIIKRRADLYLIFEMLNGSGRKRRGWVIALCSKIALSSGDWQRVGDEINGEAFRKALIVKAEPTCLKCFSWNYRCNNILSTIMRESWARSESKVLWLWPLTSWGGRFMLLRIWIRELSIRGL